MILLELICHKTDMQGWNGNGRRLGMWSGFLWEQTTYKCWISISWHLAYQLDLEKIFWLFFFPLCENHKCAPNKYFYQLDDFIRFKSLSWHQAFNFPQQNKKNFARYDFNILLLLCLLSKTVPVVLLWLFLFDFFSLRRSWCRATRAAVKCTSTGYLPDFVPTTYLFLHFKLLELVASLKYREFLTTAWCLRADTTVPWNLTMTILSIRISSNSSSNFISFKNSLKLSPFWQKPSYMSTGPFQPESN